MLEMILRGIVLVEGGMVIGLSWFVLRLYWFANKVLLERGDRVPGALPYHVWMISASHITLLVVTMSRNIVYGPWPGTPFTIVAYTLSLLALRQMLKHQQTRVYKVLKPKKER